MKSPQQRRIVSELAVGLMVCGAAQFFFVGPAERELERTRRMAEEQAEVTAPSAPVLTAEALAAMLRQAESVVEDVAARSAEARDEARLFTAIMALAQQTGVRIDQLQPVDTETARRSPADAAIPLDPVNPASPGDPMRPPPPKDGSIGYTMVVAGDYEHLVRFVHHIPDELGFAVIRSIRVSPDDSGAADAVRAEIHTEHFSFDVPGPDENGSAAAASDGGPG